MGKALLLILAALAAALYFDGSRAFMAEKAKPILDPYFEMSTKAEIDKILTDLQAYQRDNMNRIPDRREFPDWLERQYAGGADRDAWGTPYTYELDRRTYGLRSAGPDGLMGTEDDILESRTLLRAR